MAVIVMMVFVAVAVVVMMVIVVVVVVIMMAMPASSTIMVSVRPEDASHSVENAIAGMAAVAEDHQVDDVADETDHRGDQHHSRVKWEALPVDAVLHSFDGLKDKESHEDPDNYNADHGSQHLVSVVAVGIRLSRFPLGGLNC